MVRVDLRALVRQEFERRRKGANHSDQKESSQTACQECVQLLRQGTQAQQPLICSDIRVGGHKVQGLMYVPDFLLREEQSAAVHAIEATPSYRWVSAGERRMQNWGGKPGACTLAENLPPFLAALVHRLIAAGIYRPEEAPNHVLINEYSFGAGIPPHQDGPLYLDRVATITLSGPALLSLHDTGKDGNSPGSLVVTVLLKPGCLFVTSGDAYSRCLHSIASATSDLITEDCCNARLAGVRVGDVLPRAAKRYSLVFVHKKQC